MSGWVLQARKRISRLSLIWLTTLLKIFSLIVPYRLGAWVGGALGFTEY